MRILFCKISSMKYYKGHCKNDIPQFGGSFVEENGYGHEEFNFMPLESETIQCLGFVEPKSYRGKLNAIHVENIEGCGDMKKEPSVDDVLVVWCATRNRGDKTDTTVVGWYKHATVYRYPVEWTLVSDDGSREERYCNIVANADDCTLLPEGTRNQFKWNIPSAKYTRAYGFGQSMLWYPTEPEAKVFVEKLVENIDNYDGENWLEKYPEEF